MSYHGTFQYRKVYESYTNEAKIIGSYAEIRNFVSDKLDVKHLILMIRDSTLMICDNYAQKVLVSYDTKGSILSYYWNPSYNIVNDNRIATNKGFYIGIIVKYNTYNALLGLHYSNKKLEIIYESKIDASNILGIIINDNYIGFYCQSNDLKIMSIDSAIIDNDGVIGDFKRTVNKYSKPSIIGLEMYCRYDGEYLMNMWAENIRYKIISKLENSSFLRNKHSNNVYTNYFMFNTRNNLYLINSLTQLIPLGTSKLPVLELPEIYDYSASGVFSTRNGVYYVLKDGQGFKLHKYISDINYKCSFVEVLNQVYSSSSTSLHVLKKYLNGKTYFLAFDYGINKLVSDTNSYLLPPFEGEVYFISNYYEGERSTKKIVLVMFTDKGIYELRLNDDNQ